MKLFYAVLQYMPDPLRRESINVGIVFHIPSLKLSSFKAIKNKKRIKSFDDEYDIDFINLMFESLSYEFDSETLDEYGERFSLIGNDSFLDDSTKFYVNEFRFLPVESLNTNPDDLSKDMEDLEKTFLYYDRPKNERISSSEVSKLMRKRLNLYNFDFKKNRYSVKSDFADNEIFDFVNNNYAFKAISLQKSRIGDLSKEFKIFFYDLDSRKHELSNKKIFIVVDNSLDSLDQNSKNYKAYSQFKNKISQEYSNVKIYSLAKFAEHVNLIK